MSKKEIKKVGSIDSRRVVLIVLDGVGVGELPDASLYNDVGSNTLGNIKKQIPALELLNMMTLGLGNIDATLGFEKNETPVGAFGKAAEVSPGKDTVTGHWEMVGIHLEKPFPTYPDGFPDEIISEFENLIGLKTLGNEVASGTEIIARLGDEHVKTGFPIVYTSADSVFQLAAHESVIPLEKLYDFCEKAREMFVGDKLLGRIIARPFTGDSGNYKRTNNRKDYSLKPISRTILQSIKEKGLEVAAVGKIEDIFAGEGITSSEHTDGNIDGINKTLWYMGEIENGLIFTNLVDFDMKYGHRNDVEGFAKSLEEFDKSLIDVVRSMRSEDLLIVTADHGCDPTMLSTDHSREYIPVLIYGKAVNANIDLGIIPSFSDIGQTILEYLGIIDNAVKGKSFGNKLFASDYQYEEKNE